MAIFNDKNRGARGKVVVSVGNSHLVTQSHARDTREIIQDAREEAFRIKKAAEDESRKIRQEIIEIEKIVVQKEENLDTKLSQVERLEKELQFTREALTKRDEEISKVRSDLVEKLSKVSSLTADEAKKLILANLEEDLKSEIAKKIKESEEKVRSLAKEKAKEILVNAMIAGATEWVAEYTVSTVKLESDDLKGRIIGKEGRNIRSFELATGVDVELDSDVAGEIRLSSFDPIRREIAKRALDELVKDARIQPTRIEQLVKKAEAEVTADMSEAGRAAAGEVGLYNLPQEALDTLGRLKFRYSYGQNQLAASIETSKIAGKIAAELGADTTITKTGGLFHDIGKSQIDKEGTHVQLGVELAKKWTLPKSITD